MYYYKVWHGNGYADVWTYVDFRVDSKGVLVQYDTTNSGRINYAVYSKENNIEYEIFKKYGMQHSIINEKDLSSD